VGATEWREAEAALLTRDIAVREGGGGQHCQAAAAAAATTGERRWLAG